MTTEDIAIKYKKICELRLKIKALQENRKAEEQALAIFYKVDECNRERTTLALNYQDQINGIVGQISTLETELGDENI